MKTLSTALVALLLAGALGPALAQAPVNAHDNHHSSEPAAAATPPQATGTESGAMNELSEGEITRWDPRTLKVTLRHGEIKNLGMPPMTMVFRVKDAAMLAPFRPGDKVRFRVAREIDGYFVTRMEAAR